MHLNTFELSIIITSVHSLINNCSLSIKINFQTRFSKILTFTQIKATFFAQNLLASFRNLWKNYQNLFSMQKLIRIYVLATLLFLLVLHPSLCQQPEYIHKIPLRLSNNYVYYANLTFGSRNQLMELQLDTGSRTMAIFCDICERGCVLSQ